MNPEQERELLDLALRYDFDPAKLSEATGIDAFEIIRRFRSASGLLHAVLEREAASIRAATNGEELYGQFRARTSLLRKMLLESVADPHFAELFEEAFLVSCRATVAEFPSVRLRPDRGLVATIFVNVLLGTVLTPDSPGDGEIVRHVHRLLGE